MDTNNTSTIRQHYVNLASDLASVDDVQRDYVLRLFAGAHPELAARLVRAFPRPFDDDEPMSRQHQLLCIAWFLSIGDVGLGTQGAGINPLTHPERFCIMDFDLITDYRTHVREDGATEFVGIIARITDNDLEVLTVGVEDTEPEICQWIDATLALMFETQRVDVEAPDRDDRAGKFETKH